MFLVFLISELTALFTKVSENNQNSSDGCILWITGSEGRLRLPQKSKATITYHPWACVLSSAKKKWRTSTGTEAFSLLVCLDASKFVLLCLYTYAFRDDSPPPPELVQNHCPRMQKEHFRLTCVPQKRLPRQDKTRRNEMRRDETRQDRTRQDRTGQDSKGQDKTRQDRTEHGKTERDDMRQDKKGQEETRQDETRQTRQDKKTQDDYKARQER